MSPANDIFTVNLTKDTGSEWTPPVPIQNDGFSVFPKVYTQQQLDVIVTALANHGVLTYEAAETNLLKLVPEIQEIAYSELLLSAVRTILGPGARPLKAVLLGKTSAVNWTLDWHQDLKIAVRRQSEVIGYTQWSMESGIWHVVPPVSILERIVTVRIHLDTCTVQNGALLAISGSHKFGILSRVAIEQLVHKGQLKECIVPAGGIMVMSPLLVHKSPYSESLLPRRVIHLEYTDAQLDTALEWY